MRRHVCSHQRSGGCLLCTAFIPVTFMRVCWTPPVFSYYSGGICKDFHVYASSVCPPPGGERWSWLDLTHIRPPCLSNVIFLSTKQPCGGLSASGRWGSLCGQLYCSKFDETTLSVCFFWQSRGRKRDWRSEMWMRVRTTPAAAACIIYIICIITHLHTWNSQMPTRE